MTSIHVSTKDEFLTFLKLDKDYTSGKRDWLSYKNDSGENVQVLDVTGSFGINLLGFSNDVERAYHEHSRNLPPAFIQGSINKEQQKLSASLVGRIEDHTSKSGWTCAYANTGTEIIEVAIKILSRHYQARVDSVLQSIYEAKNHFMRLKTHDDKIPGLQKQIEELQRPSKFIHFTNSFHGKTLGSLSLMGNPDFQSAFPKTGIGISCGKSVSSLKEMIRRETIQYWAWDSRLQQPMKKEFVAIGGIFIEPIQGEAGVLELPVELLMAIGQAQREHGIPVVSDEIQCGLYRTGEISALSEKSLAADIYCFGKSLGAGIAKISALVCRQNIFPNDFFQFHSSSFGEDNHSAWIANRFLAEIDKWYDLVQSIKSSQLLCKMRSFVGEYPEFISDARGRGLMMAIELHMNAINQSFITKFLKDLKLFGYWIASVLLNREQIRVYPTLNSPCTLRIQPSIWFGDHEMDFLLHGLSNLFEAIRSKDVKYLFGHLFSLTDKAIVKELPHAVKHEEIPENAAVFICHPIDSEHICDIVDLLEYYDDAMLNERLDELSDFQKFTVYHVDKLQNKDHDAVDVVYFGIPLTSLSFYHALRNGQRERWIRKIQDIVDIANARNARSIGLGQFTSIITSNGMKLNSPSVPMTTGNAYTAGLTVQAVDRAMLDAGKDESGAECSIVGAGGNILSVISLMMADKFQKLNLVFHADYRFSKPTRESITFFVKSVIKQGRPSLLRRALQAASLKYDIEKELDEVLGSVKDLLTIACDLDSVIGSDVIIVGTNNPGAILTRKHVRAGTIIADISVPPNCSPDLQRSSDIAYIKGGIAALPVINGQEQHLKSVILPFGEGECYACMAETFGLAFHKGPVKHYIGDLSKEMVESVLSRMEQQGFGLKRMKVENSI